MHHRQGHYEMIIHAEFGITIKACRILREINCHPWAVPTIALHLTSARSNGLFDMEETPAIRPYTFFDLPLAIRHSIYELTLWAEPISSEINKYHSIHSLWQPPALLSVRNHQIREEVKEVYYGGSFWIDHTLALRWLKEFQPHLTKYCTKLTIDVTDLDKKYYKTRDDLEKSLKFATLRYGVRELKLSTGTKVEIRRRSKALPSDDETEASQINDASHIDDASSTVGADQAEGAASMNGIGEGRGAMIHTDDIGQTDKSANTDDAGGTLEAVRFDDAAQNDNAFHVQNADHSDNVVQTEGAIDPDDAKEEDQVTHIDNLCESAGRIDADDAGETNNATCINDAGQSGNVEEAEDTTCADAVGAVDKVTYADNYADHTNNHVHMDDATCTNDLGQADGSPNATDAGRVDGATPMDNAGEAHSVTNLDDICDANIVTRMNDAEQTEEVMNDAGQTEQAVDTSTAGDIANTPKEIESGPINALPKRSLLYRPTQTFDLDSITPTARIEIIRARQEFFRKTEEERVRLQGIMAPPKENLMLALQQFRVMRGDGRQVAYGMMENAQEGRFHYRHVLRARGFLT